MSPCSVLSQPGVQPITSWYKLHAHKHVSPPTWVCGYSIQTAILGEGRFGELQTLSLTRMLDHSSRQLPVYLYIIYLLTKAKEVRSYNMQREEKTHTHTLSEKWAIPTEQATWVGGAPNMRRQIIIAGQHSSSLLWYIAWVRDSGVKSKTQTSVMFLTPNQSQTLRPGHDHQSIDIVYRVIDQLLLRVCTALHLVCSYSCV